ncbi:MAG: hypothetical protein ACYTXA_27890 [Nostoc sp.]
MHLLFWRSQLLFRGTHLLFWRSHLLFWRSQLLFRGSQLLFWRSQLLFRGRFDDNNLSQRHQCVSDDRDDR